MKPEKKNLKIILIILGIVGIFYVGLMLAWNLTSNQNQPTNILWDWKKEGYQENPLGDRLNP